MNVISLALFLLLSVTGTESRVASRKGVSIYSRPVFVKGPQSIVVNGYPTKLGTPGTTQMTKLSHDSFVGSTISDRITSVSNSLDDDRRIQREPYRTPYVPLSNSHRHQQLVKRTTTSQPKLPECTTQQVCNALYIRLNRTQSLCSCPGNRANCRTTTDANDGHSVRLIADNTGKVLTMVKTCESISEVRQCKKPTDWALLAIQNMRTAKAHYLVLCRCPSESRLYGPTLHPNPTYAKLPGINMYGMLCVSRMGRSAKTSNKLKPFFPWLKVKSFLNYLGWISK